MILRLKSFAGPLVSGIALAGGLALAARAADPVVVSTRTTAAIAPDGALIEWPTLLSIADGLHVAVANDDTSAYVAVLASNEQMRLSLSGGVVLWFDATGGHNETFGLQLPRPGALDPASLPAGGGSGARLTPTISNQVDVLGPGKLARRLIDLTPSSGVGVGVGGEDGGIAFEVRIPLAKSAENPHAIGTAPGKTFAMGISTPLPRKGPREPMEPIVWPDPYSYYYRRPLPPTAPLTNAANRPPKELKPKSVEEWIAVRLAPAK